MKRGAGEPALPAPWGVYDLRTKGEADLRIGDLSLKLVGAEGEIRAGHWRSRGRGSEPEGRDVTWTRWATGSWDGGVSLTPTFPDRPLVVEPDTSFWLLRGGVARIYVRVPLWVHAETLAPERLSLAKIPTVAQSDTWWGTLDNGELCYWLASTARRALDDAIFQPHLAVCPIQLDNQSSDSLPIEKIALRVSHLSLYVQGQRLWADETRLAYRGETEGAELDVGREAPREAPDAQLIAGPRMRMTRGFRTLTFGRLRSLQGWI
jgi:hypothetical protein